MRNAATTLAAWIEAGEYDALNEGQRATLRGLSMSIAGWADVTETHEQDFWALTHTPYGRLRRVLRRTLVTFRLA